MSGGKRDVAAAAAQSSARACLHADRRPEFWTAACGLVVCSHNPALSSLADVARDAERRRDLVGDQHPVLLVQSQVRTRQSSCARSLRVFTPRSGRRRRTSAGTSTTSAGSAPASPVRSPTAGTRPCASTRVRLRRAACLLVCGRVLMTVGALFLYVKTIERAHTPKHMWERIKLSNNYAKALEQVRARASLLGTLLISAPCYLPRFCATCSRSAALLSPATPPARPRRSTPSCSIGRTSPHINASSGSRS
jgi:hypothetical protein